MATTSPKEPQDLQGVSVEVCTNRGLKKLNACASPMDMEKMEGKLKVEMIIDMGREMCMMSRDTNECAKGLLLVDTESHWSIG